MKKLLILILFYTNTTHSLNIPEEVKVVQVSSSYFNMLGFRGYVEGMYLPHNRRIYINRASRNKRAVLCHEIAHDVWFHGMTPRQRQKYEIYHNTERVITTQYSKVNLRENFAEMFMISACNEWDRVTTHRRLRQKIVQSRQYKFIKSIYNE